MPDVSKAELARAIKITHGVPSRFIEQVQVNETLDGASVCSVVVSVFELLGHPLGHPSASRCYAWGHDGGRPEQRRVFAVLHEGSVASPDAAVRATFAKEHGVDRRLDASREHGLYCPLSTSPDV